MGTNIEGITKNFVGNFFVPMETITLTKARKNVFQKYCEKKSWLFQPSRLCVNLWLKLCIIALFWWAWALLFRWARAHLFWWARSQLWCLIALSVLPDYSTQLCRSMCTPLHGLTVQNKHTVLILVWDSSGRDTEGVKVDLQIRYGNTSHLSSILL